MAVDCCEHILAVLERVPSSRLTAVLSKDRSRCPASNHVDLIVIGVARYPVRRLFISQLRRVFPDIPMLLLRRIEQDRGSDAIRGEFVLSAEPGHKADLEIVRALRGVLPIQPCPHVHKGRHYDAVREVVRVIADNYKNPDLDLAQVAKEIPISPIQLSRILNHEVGLSFRQILRQTRIEEAKLMLATREFSVKEVAARVGFTDSHYFSRSFKELTGLSASDYRSQDAIFG
jgi:AraC-like DNA-binding protein